MRRLAAGFAFLLLTTGLLTTPQTIAQIRQSKPSNPPSTGCGPLSNPLEALVGEWTFSSKTFAASQPFVSAGRFVASTGNQTGNPKRVPKGVLSITQTSNNNGEVISQEPLTGAYEVFEDCSGGSLTFNTSSGPIDIDFWFVADGTQFVGVKWTPFVRQPEPRLKV